jgi:hypothetical protein
LPGYGISTDSEAAMLKNFVLAVLVGVVAWPDDGGSDVLAVLKAGGLTKVTTAPLFIANPQAILCRAPAPPVPMDGPHELTFIEVYVSPDQAADFKAGRNDLPAGTLVAKEKRDGPAGEATLYTLMLKHAQGYNAAGGDWEYLVVDGRKTRVIARGMIESCIRCHARHQDTGFLVRDYLAPAAPKK